MNITLKLMEAARGIAPVVETERLVEDTAKYIILGYDEYEDMKAAFAGIDMKKTDIDAYLSEAFSEGGNPVSIVEFEMQQVNLYKDKIVLDFHTVTFYDKSTGNEKVELVKIIKYFSSNKWEIAY